MRLLLVVLTLTGCANVTPRASYQHLSDPAISNDGYDLFCGGIEVPAGNFTGSVSGCRNVAPHGGNLVKAEIVYRHRRAR